MKDLKKLLKKYEAGTCTKRELLELQQYFKNTDQTAFKEILKEDWEHILKQNPTLPSPKSEALWKQIQQQKHKVTFTGHRTKVLWKITGIAASLALFIAATSYFFFFSHNNAELKNIQEEFVGLSDGSKVWLKEGGKLHYSPHFSDSLRLVRLEGEAFFEVAKDRNRPFIVKAGTVETKVLGTTFNIRANPNDSMVAITLVEGSVSVHTPNQTKEKVDTTLLMPGEQLAFSKQTKRIKKQRYAGNLPYAWKTQIIHFDGASIVEVAQVLNEKYKVEIIIPKHFRSSSKLVHRFDVNELSIQQVLEGISKVTDYHFEVIAPKKYKANLDSPDEDE